MHTLNPSTGEAAAVGLTSLNQPSLQSEFQDRATSNTGEVSPFRIGTVNLSPRDLFLDRLRIRLGEQVEHGAAEVVGVAVRVPQLVCNCI